LINFHHNNYKLIQLLQKEGKKRTNTANISNLPSNIAKDNIHLDTFDTPLKLPLGPIMSPKPGPTLDIDVAAPEIADKKSSPAIESNIDIMRKRNKYEKIKIITELIKPSSIFCLL
tara:strand:+ start:111 stop:458 length:348 start_codon:yes stop_codon:yes gene_type:complete